LFWTPVAAWNNYNKWMFGLAFYNHTLPQKKFEYELMPLYSYTTNDIAGYGHVAYSVFPKGNIFQRITVGSSYTRYAYSNKPFDLNFNKLTEEVNVDFKKREPRSPYQFSLKYRNILLLLDNYEATDNFTPTIYTRADITTNFTDLTFKLSKEDAITPFDISVNSQQGEGIDKVSLTSHYSYNFKKKNKGIDIRFFAGAFLQNNSADGSDFRFRLSGQSGYQDYLFDHIYLGRTEREGLLSQQFTETDGGFKFFSYVGQTSKWITALNIKSSLGNMPLPIRLYADIGTTADDAILNNELVYDAGLCLSISKNIFEVYFPLLLSQQFKDYKAANNIKYEETIRFTLNLNLLNPFSLIKNYKM
jgi:hypothetical protein